MTTSSERQSNRSEIQLTPFGEKVKQISKIAGATALLAIGGVWGVSKVTAENNPMPVSATLNYDAIDKDISAELAKGPQGKDQLLTPFTVGPSNTVANAMIREDSRADIERSVIQLKATTASAETFGSIADINDNVVMWQDAELSEKYGDAVMLAMPEDR